MSETNHIVEELERLVGAYGKYHANRIDAYYTELLKINASIEIVRSFVTHWICNERQFPSYSDILTYVESRKFNAGKNRGVYSRCNLCGNTKQLGMWELLRIDNQVVAAACICNKDPNKMDWDKYDPNNPPIVNGQIRYIELSSF